MQGYSLLVLNGPNLGALGERQPELYGHAGMDAVPRLVRELLGEHNHRLEYFQSNSEGALIDRLDFGGTISAATTFVNAATAMSAFGEHERALSLFEKARPIYESAAAAEPQLLGGLYNNMALTCAALGRWDEAQALYDRAVAQMEKVPGGALEIAITCLNRADLLAARDGMEAAEPAVFDLCERAVALLDGPELVHDGYYAFVCEKCAPTLDYYGWFDDARRLREEARRIYEGA